MTTEELNHQVKAYLNAVRAIGEIIQACGEIPAGHIYARVCDRMSAETFNGMIDKLVKAQVVERERSHLLRWIGPQVRKEGGE